MLAGRIEDKDEKTAKGGRGKGCNLKARKAGRQRSADKRSNYRKEDKEKKERGGKGGRGALKRQTERGRNE